MHPSAWLASAFSKRKPHPAVPGSQTNVHVLAPVHVAGRVIDDAGSDRPSHYRVPQRERSGPRLFTPAPGDSRDVRSFDPRATFTPQVATAAETPHAIATRSRRNRDSDPVAAIRRAAIPASCARRPAPRRLRRPASAGRRPCAPSESSSARLAGPAPRGRSLATWPGVRPPNPRRRHDHGRPTSR